MSDATHGSLELAPWAVSTPPVTRAPVGPAPPSGTQPIKTAAQKEVSPITMLRPFNNWISILTAVVIGFIFLVGLGMLFSSIFLFALILQSVLGVILSAFVGTVLVIVAVSLYWGCDVRHDKDPPTAGVITVNGKYITPGGRPIIVGGETLLPKFFPFNVDTVKFPITNTEKNFEMEILSSDNLLIKLTVSVTARPDLSRVLRFLQAGKMDKALNEIQTIVYESVLPLGTKRTGDELAKKSDEFLSVPLRNSLAEAMGRMISESKDFGIEIVKVQTKCKLPEQYLTELLLAAAEKPQRDGEHRDLDTLTELAKRVQTIFRDDPERGNKPVPPMQVCLAIAQRIRIFRGAKAEAIQLDGSSGGGGKKSRRGGGGGNNIFELSQGDINPKGGGGK